MSKPGVMVYNQKYIYGKSFPASERRVSDEARRGRESLSPAQKKVSDRVQKWAYPMGQTLKTVLGTC